MSELCYICKTDEDDDLIDELCLDCWKRERFLTLFNDSSTYNLGSYFGKHLLEKYLGYYISEKQFITFMTERGFKFNEKKRSFRLKINKRKALEVLGFRL